MKITKNGNVIHLLTVPNMVKTSLEYQRYVLNRKIPIFLFQSSVAKLYNTTKLKMLNLHFDETIAVSEDSLFNTQLLQNITGDVAFYAYCGYNYVRDNLSSCQNSKKSFKKIQDGILASLKTLQIRREMTEALFNEEHDVLLSLQRAFCVVSIFNAKDIEINGFTFAERMHLYSLYLDKIQYDVSGVIKEYPYFERSIIRCTMKNKVALIHFIYKLRELKSTISGFFNIGKLNVLCRK